MPMFYRAMRIGRIWLEPQANGPSIYRHIACSGSLEAAIHAFERLQALAQQYLISAALLLASTSALVLLQLAKVY